MPKSSERARLRVLLQEQSLGGDVCEFLQDPNTPVKLNIPSKVQTFTSVYALYHTWLDVKMYIFDIFDYMFEVHCIEK